MNTTIRRNADGVPQPTREQLAAAHAYATDLLEGRASTREVPPLFLAVALLNLHNGLIAARAELAAIMAILIRAAAAGIVPIPNLAGMAAGDEDEDETAAPDPRMN